jgi:hypothetical protein
MSQVYYPCASWHKHTILKHYFAIFQTPVPVARFEPLNLSNQGKCSTTVLPGQSNTPFFAISSLLANGQIQILCLVLMRQVFYHCATWAEQHSIFIISLSQCQCLDSNPQTSVYESSVLPLCFLAQTYNTKTLFSNFSLSRARGKIRTLKLKLSSQVSCHCATGAEKNIISCSFLSPLPMAIFKPTILC